MSISLNLVIYKYEGGSLIEEGLKTIRCEEIPQSLLEEITNSFPMKEERVYFDRSLDESFEIKCFDSSDVANIIQMLHGLFRELLKHENGILNPSSVRVDEQTDGIHNFVASLLPDQSQSDPTGRSVARLRILTGIIGVFEDKQNKLADEVGAFIKLG